jgi:NAD(P)H-flavin reductase
LHAGQVVELVGPYGHFGFTENRHRGAICIAGGTGLAPIKAMIEQEIAAKSERPIMLLYDARRPADLYDLDLLTCWADKVSSFTLATALAEGSCDGIATARPGLVTNLLADTVFDGFGLEAFLCGPPAMIDALAPILEQIGVEADDIHVDRFSPARI